MESVVVENIVKRYGKKKAIVTALQGVSFNVDKGELFGLIGPDGSGKTSLFRILTTLLIPEEGKATVNGFDVVKGYKNIRKEIGYMPGRFSLYQDLSVKENLDFFATIFNTTVESNYGLIKDIFSQLEPFLDRRAGNLSGGMKQKLALSCALIHRPSILFLDEPTTGVDAVSRKEFWEMLKKLKAEGISILVSTPYMDEAGLCDRVALIQAGKIMTINTPEGIVNEFGKKLVAVKGNNMLRLLDELMNCDIVEAAYPFGEYHHTVMHEGGIDELKNCLRDEKQHYELKDVKPDIEDCFMSLMKVQS